MVNGRRPGGARPRRWVKYESHPKLRCGRMDVKQLKEQLARIVRWVWSPFQVELLDRTRCMDRILFPNGFTDTYYRFCSDLIGEVMKLFNSHACFISASDEETATASGNYSIMIVRQFDLWWLDSSSLWTKWKGRRARLDLSDYVWDHPELFYQRMPKSVLQSNWYTERIRRQNQYVKPYVELEQHGYDRFPQPATQVRPTTSG